MSRARLLLAACFAVLAVSALAVATASAAEGWDVNGTALPAGSKEAISSPVKVLSAGLLSIATGGGTVVIECSPTTAEVTGGALVGTTGVEASSVTFLSCSVTAGSCALTSPTISTLPVHGVAKLDPGSPLNTLILVLPKTKGVFAAIGFEGATCALAGVQPVKGDVDILIHEGFHPAVLHLILVFSLPKGLQVGSSEASLHKVDADIKLVSGNTWNFL